MADENNITTLAKRLRPFIKMAAQEILNVSNSVAQSLVTFSGNISISDNPLRIYNQIGKAQIITKVFIGVNTPASGNSIIVDIHKNGVTIFTNQAHRPEIAIGDYTANSIDIDVSAWADGEYLTAHIDQVGSSTAGADLAVQIITHGQFAMVS